MKKVLSAEQMEGYRLSLQQEERWQIQQRCAATPFRVLGVVAVEGALELEILRQALGRLLQRHEILRTVFPCLPGMTLPVQVIVDGAAPAVTVHDLQRFALEAQKARAQALWHRLEEQPFDYFRGPLLAIEVIRLASTHHQLLIGLSTLSGDRQTLKNFVWELGASYEAQLEGLAPVLQYADFAEWQHQLMADNKSEGAHFWRSQPTVDPRAIRVPFVADWVAAPSVPQLAAVPLPADFNVAFQALAGQMQLSLEALLLTAWLTLLHRHQEEGELLVGVASDGRTEHTASAFGPYARVLPVSLAINEAGSFLQTARRVQSALRSARAWQDYFTGEGLPGTAHTPTFLPITFAYEENHPAYRGHQLSWRLEKWDDRSTPFKLKLLCTQSAHALALGIHYDAAVCAPEAAACLADQLAALMTAIVDNPEGRLDTFSLLSKTAYRQVVVDWNRRREDFPSVFRLQHRFERQAKETPQAVALAWGGQYLTYRELNLRANRLAYYLRARRIGRNTLVGLYLDRTPEMLLGILGVLKAGAAYAPLDPRYPRERLAHILREAAISLVLSREGLWQNLPALTPQKILSLDGEQRAFAHYSSVNPAPKNRPEDLCYVIYTSGSTGLPKGVAVSHRNAVHSTASRLQYYQQPVKRFLLLPSFAFDSSVAGIFWTLSQGGCLCLPTEEEMADPAALAAVIAREQVSHLLALPSLYRLLMAPLAAQDPCPVTTVIVAGERCPGDLVAAHHKHLPGVELYNEYGPTEGTVWSSVYASRPADGDGPLPIGRPVDHTTLYVLDEALVPVAVGLPGQIYLGGEGIARGYLKQPRLTAERFIPDPFAERAGARLYQTGDRARWRPDGNLEFLGRADQQVKLRGYRIELGEIEVRLNAHPQVREAIVLLQEEPDRNGCLVAYGVSQSEQGSEPAELRRYLATALPEYMIPAAFVWLSALPLTPNGKIDRRALGRLGGPVPLQGNYQPPRGPKEKALAAIWQELLRLERVGIYDSFFDLGGDSLLSLQMVSRAKEAGLFFTPRQVFQHKTIAALAATAEVSTPEPPPDQGPVSGDVPLTPIQHWFFAAGFSNDPHFWTHALLLELTEPVNSAFLEEAARALVNHHDALRMHFIKEAGHWRQVNSAAVAQSPFQRIDLSQIPPVAQQELLETVASTAQWIATDQGLLFSTVLFDLGAAHPGYLLIAAHHLVTDGLSWRILLEDLQTAYRQLAAGQAIVLPQKTTSFQRWAQALVEYAQSETVREEASFWYDWLPRELPPWPVDNSAGSRAEAASKTRYFHLSQAETQRLIGEGPAFWQCGIEDLLMSALALALYRWSGIRRLVVDRDRYGREPFREGLDVSRTVGWFTSLSPLVLEVQPGETAAQTLLSIQRQLHQIPANGFHYGLLRYLVPPDTLSEALKTRPSAPLIINYLGQIDQIFSERSPFVLAEERIRRGAHPEWRRPYEMALDLYVMGDRLHLGWGYSGERYRQTTIEGLGQGFMRALRELTPPLTGGMYHDETQ